MKKILFTALALICGMSVTAQDSPLSFGVKAGVNLSNFDNEKGTNPDAKVGFQVGVTLDYALTSDFYLQSGLHFTTKGAKEKESIITTTYNPMYLQLPVMAAYKLSVCEGMKVVFNAGPYLAYGVGGKMSIGDIDTDLFKKIEIAGLKTNESLYKRFDYGVGGGVGFEFGKITANLGYELGLANITNVDGQNTKNRNAFLTLGYKF